MDEYKFYSYVDDKSILVITPNNKLVRIKCPFAVMDSDKKILQVDAVVDKKNQIYYKINNRHVLHRNYTITSKNSN